MKYRWQFKDYPESHGLTVFSTFACGGGSTMGYKLAGYNVLGANDIDPKMAKIYKENHKPKHYFLEDIREFTKRPDLPEELYDLDILDGSPPCTTFSTAGQREKLWGKKKKYAEGASEQTLDDLYFRFIELAEKLKPKVIVSENVKGLIQGNAIKYYKNILRRFDESGYETQTFLLNSATMGVPQRRERVFIIGKRKDLNLPKLKLKFNEEPIKFGEYRSKVGVEPTNHVKKLLSYLKYKDKCLSDISERLFGKVSGFNLKIVKDKDVYPTITATEHNYRYHDRMRCSDEDYILSGSFPTDYNFLDTSPKYVIGMSVPPLMIASIAKEIKKQWLLRGRS